MMYEKAVLFMDKRFPQGWGGCAIMHTSDDQFLISVAFETFNAGASLCMETGAMCEAQKNNLKITHSMCLSRDSEVAKPAILTACGICQERLMYWGKEVKVAVTNKANEVIFVTLEKLIPHYWGDAFPDEEKEIYRD